MNCPHCKDTGDTGSGYLDCFHCDAAQIIAAHEARKSMESAMTTTNEQMRRTVLMALVDCSHEINADSITLHRDESKAGNALSQLVERTIAALRDSAPAPQELTDAEALLRSVYIRPDLTEAGREQFIADLKAGNEELTLSWKDFCVMALLSRHPAQPVSAPVAWISVEDRLPEDETPVLIMYKGEIKIGEIRWERPGYEETFIPFQYWDDPENDGQDWDFDLVTHWMPLPPAPGVATQVSQDDLKQQNAELVKKNG